MIRIRLPISIVVLVAFLGLVLLEPRATSASFTDLSKLLHHHVEEQVATLGDLDHYHRYIGDPVGLMFREVRAAMRQIDADDDQQQQLDDIYAPHSIAARMRQLAQSRHVANANVSTTTTAGSLPILSGRTTELSHPRVDADRRSSRQVRQDVDDDGLLYSDVIRNLNAESCSRVGIATGREKNVCTRQNCQPTKLRCPPSFTLAPLKSFSGNLSQCHVEEVDCMGEIYQFPSWRNTTILKLLCEGSNVRKPDQGDLQHCSLLELRYRHSIYNFTFDRNHFCIVEEPDHARFCDSIQVQCGNETLMCQDGTRPRCVEGRFVCAYEQLSCNGAPIACSGHSLSPALSPPVDGQQRVRCRDEGHMCEHKHVTCSGDEVRCEQGFTCDETESLLHCNGELVMCQQEPISCLSGANVGSAAHVACLDSPRPLVTYRPRIVCNDTLEQCEALQVRCVKLLSSGGTHYSSSSLTCPSADATWKWNGTHANCVNERDTSVKPKAAECSEGSLVIECKYDHLASGVAPECHNPIATCSNEYWDEQYPEYDVIEPCTAGQLTYDADNVYCNGSRIFCTREPSYNITRRACADDNNDVEQCKQLEWRCAPDDANNCRFAKIECVDACWVRNGTWSCICPLDYFGAQCELPRPYRCAFKLHHPLPSCRPFPTTRKLNLLDVSPICYEFSVHQTMRFQYTLNCTFSNHTGIAESIAEDFAYFARRNSSFAVSCQRTDDNKLRNPTRNAAMKIFNLNRLTDVSASFPVELSPGQLTGAEPIYFNVDFGQLYQSPTKRKRYFSGGRLYVETELFEPGLRNIPAGQEVRQPSVLLLDFHDFEFVINKELNTGFAYYAFIIFYSPNLLTAVCVLLLAIISWAAHRAYMDSLHARRRR